MRKSINCWAVACFVLALALGSPIARGAVEIVSTISASPVADQWFASDITAGGTAAIVNLAGTGGNLENNQPLPTGAAKLTTDLTNAAKAEISYAHDFGPSSSVLGSIQVSYSYYRDNIPGSNTAAAPAIKLTFWATPLNPGTPNENVTLIYEPYWNQTPSGVSVDPPTGAWQNVAIDKDNGLFWQNGGFGQANSSGGLPLKTLAQWAAAFNADPDPTTDFDSAHLVSVQVGVGTYNQGQIGYFDAVQVVAPNFDTKFNFEAVPEPASLGLWGIASLAGLGLARLRRKKSS